MINVLMSRSILGADEMVESLKDVIKKEHKVVILLYSFFDKQFQNENAYHVFYERGSEKYESLMQSFTPYGIDQKNITLINYYKTSTKDAIKAIQDADIIYFPGGSPEQMMQRIIEKGLLEVIEKHQKIYVGSSAGAMIQMHHYHISKDRDYPRFSYEQGLNLLNGFSIEVHYRRRKVQKSAMRKVFRAYRHPIFTIPDDGALIVYDDEIELVGTADLLYLSQGIYK